MRSSSRKGTRAFWFQVLKLGRSEGAQVSCPIKISLAPFCRRSTNIVGEPIKLLKYTFTIRGSKKRESVWCEF